MNRSALIACAAIMILDEMTLLNVVRLVKKKRGYLLTNKSFQRQLCLLAAKESLLGEKPSGYSDDALEEEAVVECLLLGPTALPPLPSGFNIYTMA
eukprot:1167309-Ditylum_brightwellii.AAC.1